MSKKIVRVLPLFTKNPPGKVVSTVARYSGLSPFLIGPCELWGGYWSKNMENAWQFSKVYAEHVDRLGRIRQSWLTWAKKGWRDPKAHRYPMGKGAVPEFSFWESYSSSMLDYITARKVIYGPLYAEAVQNTEDWRKLKQLYKQETELALLDYDAYDHRKLGMTLTDVINNPHKKMGHAFVLAMLLTDDSALEEMEMRS